MATPPRHEPRPVGDAGTDRGILNSLGRGVVRLSVVFNWIAGIGLVGMLLLVVADIIGIKVLSRPVPGGVEIVTFLAVVAIGFAVSYTALVHGHVAVDFVVDKLPRRAKLVVSLVTLLLSIGLVAVLAYYTFEFAARLRSTGEVSMTQKIPFYPFVYGLGVCWVMTALVLVREFVQKIAKVVKIWTL